MESCVMEMKAPRSFETSVSIYHSAWSNIIEVSSPMHILLRNAVGFPTYQNIRCHVRR